MKTVAINEPCHENWGAMTPSEKGAFCGKCAIDVIDFSNKTPVEVKLILEESAGKHLCGRFKKTQLDDLNEKYADWENQDSRTLTSKFLYALLLVFGMTLFTGCGEDEIIMGDVYYEDYQGTGNPGLPDSTKQFDAIEAHFENYGSTTEQDTPVVEKDEWKHIKGKVAYHPPIEEELYTKGEIAYTPDTAAVAPVVEIPVVETEPEIYMLGQLIYTPEPEIIPVQTEPVIEPVVDTTILAPVVPIDVISAEKGFTAKVYPNPTRDVATILIEIKADAYFAIDLFDINGQYLAPVYKGYLKSGSQRFDIPMATYKTGNYIVTVIANGENQTVKIQKVE